MRDTLAFVVEHFANTSNFNAGPDDEARHAGGFPFIAAMLEATALDKERILDDIVKYILCTIGSWTYEDVVRSSIKLPQAYMVGMPRQS